MTPSFCHWCGSFSSSFILSSALCFRGRIFSSIMVFWCSLGVILLFSLSLFFILFFHLKKKTWFSFAPVYRKSVLADVCVLYHSSCPWTEDSRWTCMFCKCWPVQSCCRLPVAVLFECFVLFINTFLLSLHSPPHLFERREVCLGCLESPVQPKRCTWLPS